MFLTSPGNYSAVDVSAQLLKPLIDFHQGPRAARSGNSTDPVSGTHPSCDPGEGAAALRSGRLPARPPFYVEIPIVGISCFLDRHPDVADNLFSLYLFESNSYPELLQSGLAAQAVARMSKGSTCPVTCPATCPATWSRLGSDDWTPGSDVFLRIVSTKKPPSSLISGSASPASLHRRIISRIRFPCVRCTWSGTWARQAAGYEGRMHAGRAAFQESGSAAGCRDSRFQADHERA